MHPMCSATPDGDAARTADADANSDAAPVDSATDVPTDTAPPVPTFPLVDPPAGFGGLPSSPPLTLSNQTARTVSNLSITNTSGDCVVVHGGSDVVLEHLSIGPCSGHGIVIDSNVQRVTIRDVYVHDAGGNGVDGYQAHGVQILDSHFARVMSGAYLQSCDAVRFERNTALNVQGPIPRGQMIQFNQVRSADNVIRCNLLEDRPGESNPEDAINMFQSAGTTASPILIEGNRILGGGPSMSGGGILIGDGGGHDITARSNILVDPGQYGMAVPGGDHMTLASNRIYGRQQSFTNVGLYVWDQYMSSCTAITVTDNQVHWTANTGGDNGYWNGGNCGTIALSGNDWSAALTPAIIE